MEMIRKICICCPAGCHLEILRDDKGITVSGHTCKRGEEYARQELSDPRRIVTAVVLAKGGKRVCVPVKTSEPLPKALIPELLKELSSLRVALPVEIGDVIIKDFRSTGIDIVASSEC